MADVVNTGATEIAPALFENPETEHVTLFYGSNRPGSQVFDVYASVVGEDGYFGPGALGRSSVAPGATRAFSSGKMAWKCSSHRTAPADRDLSTFGRRRGTRSPTRGRRPLIFLVPSTAPPTMAPPGFHGTGRRCISSRRVPSVMGRGTSGPQPESRLPRRTLFSRRSPACGR